jgi:hypothetical protein
MLVFLVSLLSVAAVFSIGAGIASAISLIPPSILERAATGGRYFQLGLHDAPAPRRPAGRRRAPPMRAMRAMRAMGGSVLAVDGVPIR